MLRSGFCSSLVFHDHDPTHDHWCQTLQGISECPLMNVHSFIEYARLEGSQIPKHSTLVIAYSAHMVHIIHHYFGMFCQAIWSMITQVSLY